MKKSFLISALFLISILVLMSSLAEAKLIKVITNEIQDIGSDRIRVGISI